VTAKKTIVTPKIGAKNSNPNGTYRQPETDIGCGRKNSKNPGKKL
tara:strand:- start:318 stop:452 length:135 start_codon:yes stop_codon:yes gene_type:complete